MQEAEVYRTVSILESLRDSAEKDEVATQEAGCIYRGRKRDWSFDLKMLDMAF